MIVLTTVSLNKIMMESRNRKLSEYLNEYLSQFRITKEKYEEELQEQNDYIIELEKNNKTLTDYIKKSKSKK